MQFAFITDLHLDPEMPLLLGHDTRQQFLDVVDAAVALSPDVIVLGGDICHRTGASSVYKWVREAMRAYDVPFRVIAGNHDDSRMMGDAFGIPVDLETGELYYLDIVSQVPILFLDSSRGKFSDRQWQWFAETVERLERKEIVVCMHHPPARLGSAHMEPAYMFLETERIHSFCASHAVKSFTFITGHYHMEKTLVSGNLTLYCSPSTYVQIDPTSETFVPVHTKGFRWIEWEGERVTTNVWYI